MNSYLFGLLLATGVTTILLRAFPFLAFGRGSRPPALIEETQRLISPAAIAMLTVYCFCAYFDGASFAEKSYGAAEAIAAFSVVAIHLMFKNPLCSIVFGTAVYMFFVQKIFIQ